MPICILLNLAKADKPCQIKIKICNLGENGWESVHHKAAESIKCKLAGPTDIILEPQQSLIDLLKEAPVQLWGLMQKCAGHWLQRR